VLIHARIDRRGLIILLIARISSNPSGSRSPRSLALSIPFRSIDLSLRQSKSILSSVCISNGHQTAQKSEQSRSAAGPRGSLPLFAFSRLFLFRCVFSLAVGLSLLSLRSDCTSCNVTSYLVNKIKSINQKQLNTGIGTEKDNHILLNRNNGGEQANIGSSQAN
jgi:hypothetical protein